MKVEVIEDWGWWFKVGQTYEVTPYPYRATREASIDFCNCWQCMSELIGKELFEMYESIENGGIIPVVACRPISAGDMRS